MIITIDGPAGAGKSTISKLFAQKYNINYLNSGAFYRAVCFVAQSLDDIEDDKTISSTKLEKYTKVLIPNLDWDRGSIKILIDDINFRTIPKILKDELFTSTISILTSYISKIQEIRAAINARIRIICSDDKISWITEGRDAGSVIFPDTPYKFYLDASLEERAKRRHAQEPNLAFETILKSIQERDKIDSNKGSASLKISDNSIYINTSNLSIVKILDKLYNIVNISE